LFAHGRTLSKDTGSQSQISARADHSVLVDSDVLLKGNCDIYLLLLDDGERLDGFQKVVSAVADYGPSVDGAATRHLLLEAVISLVKPAESVEAEFDGWFVGHGYARVQLVPRITCDRLQEVIVDANESFAIKQTGEILKRRHALSAKCELRRLRSRWIPHSRDGRAIPSQARASGACVTSRCSPRKGRCALSCVVTRRGVQKCHTRKVQLNTYRNNTDKRYSGYEVLNISPSDVFTGAEYNYAQAAVAVSISGLEMLQNSGEEAIIDLLEGRIENAEQTLTNNVALDIYSNGTADGGRQIGGLQLLVSATPSSGIVGGIDPSVWQFWRNVFFSGLTTGGAAVSTATIQTYMNRVYLQLVRGADAPDLIVADNNFYRYYLESLQALQRIGDEDLAELGFQTLKYMNCDVVLDGGFGGGAPVNTMFFLNTKYLFFRPHQDRNFAPLGDERFAVNQDAMVKLVGFAGNMTTSNRFLQGLLAA
jgi:hypothetical protein